MAVSEFSFMGGMVLGFASTLHCAGMCGGIATSLTLMFAPETTGDRVRILTAPDAPCHALLLGIDQRAFKWMQLKVR